MLQLKTVALVNTLDDLEHLPDGKLLINTLNAYSYNNAQKDPAFAEALLGGDALLPDGMSIVTACRLIRAHSRPERRIAGWDFFASEMQRLQRKAEHDGVRRRVMFLGSSELVLERIVQRVHADYPLLEVHTCSPPYRAEFTDADNAEMLDAIHRADPDLLWIGMTAPKQEKWAYAHWSQMNVHCHVGTIGAVFDFYAGTLRRAPEWMQRCGLEWLFRLLCEPRRMWRRYILGNAEFLARVVGECLKCR